jgi:FMN phosphatase YigB (HAD superfamily)
VINSIDTVFFDFDGTLVYHQPDSFDVISAFCSDIGQALDADTERIGRRTRHQYFVDPSIRDRLDTLARDQFWQHFNRYLLEALQIEGDLDQLARELSARFAGTEMTYHCPGNVCLTLTEVRAMGYGVGLITNRGQVAHFYELLDRLQLRSFFDLILASGEVGIHKPDPGVFYAALEQAGTTAEQALYVGDNYWADVVGAQRAGLQPVLLDPRHLFPEADCLVLERIEDLLTWLR